MVTFFAGPVFNIISPRSHCRLRKPLRRSCDRPCSDDTQPHRDETQDHAQTDVEPGNEKFTVLKCAKALEFKCGKGAVATDKSDRNKVGPIRIPVCPFR